MNAQMGRRRFLAGVGAAVGGAALAACGGSTDDTESTQSAGSPSQSAGSTGSGSPTAVLPARKPFGGVRPDIAAGADGLPAGFFHYPANPPQALTGPVGSGETFTLMTPGALTVPHGNNQWWQALEKSMNITWKFLTAPSADYNKKFQVSVAGSDISDLTYIVQVQDMPQVLEQYFLDLTPLLAGDKVAA